MAYDPLIAIITLVGSILSCVATSLVLLSYIIYRDQQRSFRHALILNLALAEFANSLNNSISGIIFVSTHVLNPGPGCTFNGWIGQLTVQAADFSILAIALVTVLTITRKTYMPTASLGKKVLICMSVWIVPLITSTTATGMNQMVPVSGNWCWISAKRTDLRYALGHGWRFAIIFVTIGVYAYVWFYMHRHFKQMAESAKGSSGGASSSSRRSNNKKGFEVMEEEDLEMHPVPPVANSHAHVRLRSDYNFETSAKSAVVARTDEESVAPHDTRNSNSIFEAEDLELPIQDHTGTSLPTTPRPPPSAQTTIQQEQQQQQPPPASAHAATPATQPLRSPPPHAITTDAATTTIIIPPALQSPPPRTHKPTSSVSTLGLSSPPPRFSGFGPGAGNTNRASTFSSVSATARRQSKQVEREIKRMLLLNAYPIMYVILWIPGIVNRLLEATGHKSKTLAVLQSSSQYVGLANALTYGFNEHLRERIRGDLFGWGPLGGGIAAR